MALRNVTLTGTTIGSGISTVDIYHSYVDPSNLIASGVSSSDLATGYTFQDQDFRWKYVVSSDASCSTTTNVWLPNAPVSTWTEGQIVDISNITITNDITGIASVENDWMLIANQTLIGASGGQFIVRSDTNGSTWVKEIYAGSSTHQAPTHNDIVGLKTGGLILWAGHAENTSTDSYIYNSRTVWSSDGGDTWEDVLTLSQGTSGGVYSPIVAFFQDKQSKINSSSTRRDAKDHYTGFLGQYFNNSTAHQSHTFGFWQGTSDFSSFNVSDVSNFVNYMTSSTIYKNNTTVGGNYNLGGIKSYDTRLSSVPSSNTANFVQISGHVNGYLIRATNSATTTIDSGGSGTNFNITAVGHNQEIVSTSAATWLAAVINPNQDSNTQQFIISYNDGVTWEDYVGTNMDTSRINDIAYVNGRWYAVGVGTDGTTGRICSTADLNDPWDQVSTTKPCLSIGIGDIVQNTKIIVGCEDGYIVQNQI